MMNEKDNIAVIQRHVDDVRVDITFNQLIDAEGNKIFARVYSQFGTVIGNVEASGIDTFGGLKGDEITITCDFSALPSAKDYYIKFYTAEDGVLAKAALVVFNTDGFTIGEYEAPPETSEALALIDPGAGRLVISTGQGAQLQGQSGLTFSNETLSISGGLAMSERVDHPSVPSASVGQLWVKDDTPNTLWFTDDAGNDIQLGLGGGPGSWADPVNANIVPAFTNTYGLGTSLLEFSQINVRSISSSVALNFDAPGYSFESSGIDIDFTGNPIIDVGSIDVDDVRIDNNVISTLGVNTDLELDPTGTGGVVINSSLFIADSPGAQSDRVGYGQLWIRDDSPNTLMFTDDSGNDWAVSGSSINSSQINSNDNIAMMIDADNNGTDSIFTVRSNGVFTNLLAVQEDGLALINDRLHVGTGATDGYNVPNHTIVGGTVSGGNGGVASFRNSATTGIDLHGFFVYGSNGTDPHEVAAITGQWQDSTAASEDGILVLQAASNGSLGDVALFNPSLDSLTFFANTGTFAINSSGNVNMAIDANLADDEFARWRVEGNDRFAEIGLSQNAAAGSGEFGYIRLDPQDGADRYIWIDGSNVVRTGAVGSLGQAAGTVVGTQTSDERMKDIDEDFIYGLDHINQLNPISFVYKLDPFQNKRLGLGAQHTEKIIPESVYNTRESDTIDKKEVKDILAMDSSQIVPVLIKAVQELSYEVESLRDQLLP